jgi:choline dehydrogenase-like flavoprotein
MTRRRPRARLAGDLRRAVTDVRTGRFERSLAALAAVGAAITAAEIFTEHWATLGALCEFLPRYENAVTLASATKDRFGLPVAHFSYSQGDNDKALVEAARGTMEAILRGAGATEVITIDRYAHLVGGCRMGDDETEGVVDADLRSFAVPNLYVTDGSVLPTQGAANPALTIMALAARCADRLIAGSRSGLRARAGRS